MSAFDFHRVFEFLLANLASTGGAMFLDGLEQFLFILFSGDVRIIDPFPSFSFLLFKILLKFPASLIVGSVVKV